MTTGLGLWFCLWTEDEVVVSSDDKLVVVVCSCSLLFLKGGLT